MYGVYQEIANIEDNPRFQDGECQPARGQCVGQDMTVQFQNKDTIIGLQSSKTMITTLYNNHTSARPHGMEYSTFS